MIKIEIEVEIPDRIPDRIYHLVSTIPKEWKVRDRNEFLKYFNFVIDQVIPIKEEEK